MRLRRESGDFQIAFAEPGSILIRKGLSLEDLIGQVVRFAPTNGEPAVLTVCVACWFQGNVIYMKVGYTGNYIFTYKPETGLLTYSTT